MRDLQRFDNNFTDLMSQMFSTPKVFDFNGMNDVIKPNIDISEAKDKYTIKADMPGLNKEDINVSYHDGLLTISAKRNIVNKKTDKDNNLIYQERATGSFKRTLTFDNIDEHQIHANYTNGVLTLTLPKVMQDAKDDHKIDIE